MYPPPAPVEAKPPELKQQQQQGRGGLVADPESELGLWYNNLSIRRPKIIVLIFCMLVITQYFQASKTLSFIMTSNNLAEVVNDINNSVLADEQDMMKSSSEDTAIIITSSWIPTHPSTYMIEMAINSTKNQIAGLSPSAPIFITIDHFRLGDFDKLASDIKEQRLQSLDQYTVNLYNIFLSNPRVYIIPSVKHVHIGGSVAKAMNLIERHFPSVRYLYYMQHDFYFAKQVNHTALISAMEKYPDKINYVLFRKEGLPLTRIKPCGEESPINLYTESNATTETTNSTKMIQPQEASPRLIPTATYTDNNHLVRFQWYKATIESLISLARAPENPLQKRAYDACKGRSDERMGLYVYQEPSMLVHLDGRHNSGDQPSQNNQTTQVGDGSTVKEFCGSNKWLGSNISCKDRAAFLVSRHHISEQQAETSLLEQGCKCST